MELTEILLFHCTSSWRVKRAADGVVWLCLETEALQRTFLEETQSDRPTTWTFDSSLGLRRGQTDSWSGGRYSSRHSPSKSATTSSHVQPVWCSGVS